MENQDLNQFDQSSTGRVSPSIESEPKLKVLNLKCAPLSEVLPWNDLWFSFFEFGANSTEELARIGRSSPNSPEVILKVLKEGVQSREPIYLANFGAPEVEGEQKKFSCFLVPKPRPDDDQDIKDMLQYCIQMISGVAKASLGIILSESELKSENSWLVYERLIFALGRGTALNSVSFLTPPAQYLELVNRLALLRVSLQEQQKEFICEIFH